MQLRRVCVASVAAAGTSLAKCSAADGPLTLPRQLTTRGLHGRRRVDRCSVHMRVCAEPLRASWRGNRRPTPTLECQALQVSGATTNCTRNRVNSCGDVVAACTRSLLVGPSPSRAALETPRRCCASLTGVERAPSSRSRDSLRVRGSRSTRPSSDSLPSSAARHQKISQQRQRRAQAPAHYNSRPFPEHSGNRSRLRAPNGYQRHGGPPSTAEEAVPKDDAAGASVGGDATGPSTAAGATSQSAAVHDVTAGWGLEDVSCRTGRTQLEELYERNADRIRAILEQPLPAMPQDGSVDPDFFVGFASYSYQLRDQYRAVLARELQVPVRAVRLSVAWSGRFDVRRFGRVQKVCGVCLDRQVLVAAAHGEREKNPGAGLGRDESGFAAKTRIIADGEAALPSSASTLPLPEALQKRIQALVAAINGRRRDDLLQVSFFQASPPIPEVEFALTRREHRLLFYLHEWIRRRVLQSAVVAVVYGVPPPPPAANATATRTASASPRRWTDSPERHETAHDTANTTNSDRAQQAQYEQWRRLCSTRTAAQKREVQDRWLRLLHRRKLVPLMMSLTELATLAAAAVVRGEVPGIAFQHTKVEAVAAVEKSSDEQAAVQETSMRGAETSPAVLDATLQDVLRHIAAASSSSPPFTPDDDGKLAEDSDGRASHPLRAQDVIVPLHDADSETAELVATPPFRPVSTAQKKATMRWVRVVYQALLLREVQGSADDSVCADTEHPTMRVSHQASLPALFAHGAYAGGREEVIYLQRNRAAMDALLLHPHEISFKKKFVSRMRNGHRRLRMEEESAPPYSTNG
ncbi:hypothetical protein LSCM4_05439 [Leishmania orientalis]|uniref:Uncharacterized protein n=1 Tax=Leishmania orientalis TaxID=2249476 RepID=A0A836KKV4_9TRYP|nr:hypothetical protein LSCM4_05439 [Leishmania orientalis]